MSLTMGIFFDPEGPFENAEHAVCAICGAIIAIRKLSITESFTTQVIRTMEVRVVTAVEALLYDLIPGQKIQEYFCNQDETHYKKPVMRR